MAIKNPIVLVGGTLQEIKAPDTIDPSVLPATASAGRTFSYFMA